MVMDLKGEQAVVRIQLTILGGSFLSQLARQFSLARSCTEREVHSEMLGWWRRMEAERIPRSLEMVLASPVKLLALPSV